MESAEITNQLLKNKYDLHKSPEVEAAVNRTQLHTGEKVPQNPLIRIQNYLDRLDNLINPAPLEGHPHFNRQERNLKMLKSRLYDKVVIKPEQIPESFWENQKRIIRERGQAGDLEQVDFEELKGQNTEAIIADQRTSLDKWINYFASPDSSWVPDALKYYAFRNVLKMGEYDKDKKAYPERSIGTTKPFPDLNREALAYVLDALNKKYNHQQVDLSALNQEEQQQFDKLLKGENFAKLYAFAIEKVTPASPEQLNATSGEWVKYNQKTDHMPLVRSLQGHGTGWCTAGESTAQTQLQGGDFYVYYSLDQDGKPTIPRAAIRMEEGKIAEVRGLATDQNLDTGIIPVVEEKLKEFPNGQLYKKRVHDMELVTAMESKVKGGQELTGQELAFLYEIDSPIEGFGYSKDPRIAELRFKRNPQEDMPIIFGCDKRQIASSAQEIRSDTKAYVGPLEPGIFNLLSQYNIEQIYTSFPEGKIRKEVVEIGGKAASQLEMELAKAAVNVSRFAQDMMRNPDFTISKTPQSVDTVRLRVQDLGFNKGYSTTDQIYKRAGELGLELCPAEVGPNLRLKDVNQPMGEWYYIGMKQILDSDGHPLVFELEWNVDGLCLDSFWAIPGYKWNPAAQFVFSLRKSEPQNPQSLSLFHRFLKR